MTDSELNERHPKERRPAGWFWWTSAGMIVLAGLVTLAPIALAVIQPEHSEKWLASAVIASVGLVAVAAFPVIGIVQLGQYSSQARVVTLLGWMAFVVFGAAMVAGAILAPYLQGNSIRPGFFQPLLGGLAISAITSMIGLFSLSLAGRHWAAARLPLDPHSFPQATALASMIPAIGFCLAPLIVLNRPVALSPPDKAVPSEGLNGVLLAATVGQFVLIVSLVIVAAGWPILRSFRGAIARLGVGPLTRRAVFMSVLVTLALVVGVGAYKWAQTRIWTYFGWPTTDEAAFKQLMDFALNWYAPLIIGTAAGVGEELFVRGLLQPRFGILLPNLLFAAMHAFQYHWDGVIGVFLIGLVCGFVRRAYNTSASMLVHGLYDVVVMYLAVALKQ